MRGGYIFIGLAFCIDALQVLLDWAFVAMTSAITITATVLGMSAACTAGAVVGGIAGAAAGGVGAIPGAMLGCSASAIAAAASTYFVVSSVATPLGVGIGFAVNLCISATFGFGFIAALFMFGVAKMEDWKIITGSGLFEIIPGLDVLPGWTLMTVRCVLRANAREGKLTGSAAGAYTAALAKTTLLGKGIGLLTAVNQSTANMTQTPGGFTKQQQTTDRKRKEDFIVQDLKSIDGMRRPQRALERGTNEAYAN